MRSSPLIDDLLLLALILVVFIALGLLIIIWLLRQ